MSHDLNQNLKSIDVDYINNKFYELKNLFNDQNILQIMQQSLNSQEQILTNFKDFIIEKFDIRVSIDNNAINDFICGIFRINTGEVLTGGNPDSIPVVSIENIKKRIRHKEIMATGGNGKIYKDGNKAIKIISKITSTDLDLEVEMYKYFFDKNIGPQLFKKFHTTKPGTDEPLIKQFIKYIVVFCAGICPDDNQYMGGYTLKLYTSDVHDLLSHKTLFNYKNIDDKLTMLERRIIHMLDILYDSASEKSYFCTDIKYKNMLVDYKIENENLIMDDKDVVLHDFDKTHCQKDMNSLSEEDKKNILSVMKSLSYLTLILIQVEISIERKKNV